MTREDEINLATRDAFLKAGVDKESYRQGVEWADKHPRNGLFDVDGACDWLMDNLPTYSEMTPLMIDCFVGAFKNFCKQKNKKL